uniref:Secreted protein n=1 Tax=Syphacia muris TaxID=451379 RepID=A0A0N5A7K8_9BILA
MLEIVLAVQFEMLLYGFGIVAPMSEAHIYVYERRCSLYNNTSIMDLIITVHFLDICRQNGSQRAEVDDNNYGIC